MKRLIEFTQDAWPLLFLIALIVGLLVFAAGVAWMMWLDYRFAKRIGRDADAKAKRWLGLLERIEAKQKS